VPRQLKPFHFIAQDGTLTAPGKRLLGVVKADPSFSYKVLAERFGVGSTAITKALHKMADQGLLAPEQIKSKGIPARWREAAG
jgi:hypothetical protein